MSTTQELWRVSPGREGAPGTLPAIERASDPHPCSPLAVMYPGDDPRGCAEIMVAEHNALVELGVEPDKLVERVRQTVEALKRAEMGITAIYNTLRGRNLAEPPDKAGGQADFLARRDGARAALALWEQKHDA